jgi:small subunit ribosomal protein S2
MLNLKELLKAGIHFGHKSSRWSPKMKPYIWGTKNKIHLIDVAKTSFLMERAGKYLKNLASEGKSMLWVGTKKAAQENVKQKAESLKMPFVINRWIGGTLTNFDQVKKAITRLLHLRDVIKKPTHHYKKKEISMIQKEIERLEKNIGGILDLDFPPAAIILIDAKKERSVVREAVNAQIPIIAMVDTNTNPEGINFVIPSNDDSPRAINYVLEYLSSCIQDGKKIYEEKKAKEEIEVKKEKEATKKAAPPKPAAKKTTTTVKPTATPADKTEDKKPTVKKTVSSTKTTEKAAAKKTTQKKAVAKKTTKVATKKTAKK